MAGMSAGSEGLKNEPNVVPMIDVLLVLLIIFMMIIPLSRVAIDLQLPDLERNRRAGPGAPSIGRRHQRALENVRVVARRADCDLTGISDPPSLEVRNFPRITVRA